MNITRADKKNIQKGTAAKKSQVHKSCITFSAESLCGGRRQQLHRIHVRYIPGSVRCNVVYLPYLEVCYRPGIHSSI